MYALPLLNKAWHLSPWESENISISWTYDRYSKLFKGFICSVLFACDFEFNNNLKTKGQTTSRVLQWVKNTNGWSLCVTPVLTQSMGGPGWVELRGPSGRGEGGAWEEPMLTALWAAPPLHWKVLQLPGGMNSRLTLLPGCHGCVATISTVLFGWLAL